MPEKRSRAPFAKGVAMRIQDVPERYRGLYRRAMTGKSRRAAVRANCLMCCGWQFVEVERCTAPTCPLYPYRLGAAVTEPESETAGELEPVASL